jgi:hypothetical protein
MAQSTLHFAFGMAIGSAWALPALWRTWWKGTPVAGAIGRWLLLAYGLGIYATLPNILRRMTQDSEWTTGTWTHIFLLHPLIERLDLPSMAFGELAIAACFAAQYAVILIAIRRAKHTSARFPGRGLP